MVDFKTKIREILNISICSDYEKFGNKKLKYIEILKKNKESRNQIKNETNFSNKSSNKFFRSNIKNTYLSPMRSDIMNTTNESKNHLFDSNKILLKKTPRRIEEFIKSEIPLHGNRKQEFYKLKYSDLLGKKVESSKFKNNKFINSLLNEDECKININNAKDGYKNLTFNTKNSKSTKNTFMNELRLFSQSLKLDNSNKIVMNKPAINVRSNIDAKFYLALSPTNRQYFYKTSSIIKTGQNDRFSSFFKINASKPNKFYDKNTYLNKQ